jgi:uncharacterized protein YrzB (UPF0473 family)
MSDEELITLQGEDGVEHVCRVLGVFDFEEKEYALVLDLGEAGADPAETEPDAVLMRLHEQDGEAVFRTIEDDGEFTRVSTYVKDLAAEQDDDGEEDED